MGYRPRSCPRCGGRKVKRKETAGSMVKGLVSNAYFVGASLATLGVYALVGNEPRKVKTYRLECKNRKCRFVWEEDVE